VLTGLYVVIRQGLPVPFRHEDKLLDPAGLNVCIIKYVKKNRQRKLTVVIQQGLPVPFRHEDKLLDPAGLNVCIIKCAKKKA